MRWEDERYVRAYTRDTLEWLALGWEAHALFWELLRKVDRAGILQLGSAGHVGISIATGIPIDVVERALPALLRDRCVTENGTTLVIKNYIDAQEAKSSDKQRQREHRARARDLALSQNVTPPAIEVTKRDEKSHAVTGCHARSRAVTPSRTEPSRDLCVSGSSLPLSASDPDQSTPRANEPGKPSPYNVVSQFLAIRAEVLEVGEPFAQPSDGQQEKAAPWLASMDSDAVADVEPAIRLALQHVKRGDPGWTNPAMTKAGFLWGSIIAQWSDLREELHGCAPTPTKPSDKFATPPDWRKHLAPNARR